MNYVIARYEAIAYYTERLCKFAIASYLAMTLDVELSVQLQKFKGKCIQIFNGKPYLPVIAVAFFYII